MHPKRTYPLVRTLLVMPHQDPTPFNAARAHPNKNKDKIKKLKKGKERRYQVFLAKGTIEKSFLLKHSLLFCVAFYRLKYRTE